MNLSKQNVDGWCTRNRLALDTKIDLKMKPSKKEALGACQIDYQLFQQTRLPSPRNYQDSRVRNDSGWIRWYASNEMTSLDAKDLINLSLIWINWLKVKLGNPWICIKTKYIKDLMPNAVRILVHLCLLSNKEPSLLETSERSILVKLLLRL